MTNDLLSNGLNKLDSETATALSTQSTWMNDNTESSLLFISGIYENTIYFNGSYKNSKDRIINNFISFQNKYYINEQDKIDINVWSTFLDASKNSSDRYQEEYGGSISLYKKFYYIDTYNSISYVTGTNGLADGWNYNATISYPYSKQLVFFLKGRNLLNKALKSNYISTNFMNGTITQLNNVSNIDRTVWFGLEYQF